MYCEILSCAFLDPTYETIHALIAPDRSAVRTAVSNAHDALGVEARLGIDTEGWSQRATDAIAGGRFVTTWYYTPAPPRPAAPVASGVVDTTKQALTPGGALGWFQHRRNAYAAIPSPHIGRSFLYALTLS